MLSVEMLPSSGNAANANASNMFKAEASMMGFAGIMLFSYCNKSAVQLLVTHDICMVNLHCFLLPKA